jgi:hypothetical protein
VLSPDLTTGAKQAIVTNVASQPALPSIAHVIGYSMLRAASKPECLRITF